MILVSLGFQFLVKESRKLGLVEALYCRKYQLTCCQSIVFTHLHLHFNTVFWRVRGISKNATRSLLYVDLQFCPMVFVFPCLVFKSIFLLSSINFELKAETRLSHGSRLFVDCSCFGLTFTDFLLIDYLVYFFELKKILGSYCVNILFFVYRKQEINRLFR